MRARYSAPLIVVLTVFTILAGSPVRAGQLAPDLEQAIAQKSPDEFISVWIKLPPVESSDQLKRAANPAASAVEQHAALIARLQSNQTQAQQDLREHLRDLEQQNRVRNIHAYWITNMVVAEIAAVELPQLAGRTDVEIVYSAPEIVAITPISSRTGAEPAGLADSVAAQLTYNKATQAWGAGFDGTGRIVCSFDSGIDGDHPALAGNWKGNDGNWQAAWFDPVGDDSAPHTIFGSANASHGTQVLGMICGYDSTIGYAIGVAPGAQWISAAVTDLPTGNSHAILEAFEWAADPDGNPNTIADRPDVINHSWGFTRNDHSISCEDIFFEAIDNIEALGIINIFAAGNSGSSAQTIANPANRALDSIDCFAVGAVNIADTANPTIASFSSRGPSDCDGLSIKPNIVAPGASVRTCTPGGLYASPQGTSFAAPQVAGLVALMRQKNPNLTVAQIKTAILNTASDAHFGGLPNNTYGWGELDCFAAVSSISGTNAQPNVRVYDFTYTPVEPGDTLEGIVTINNLGAAATNVSGLVSSADPDFTVLDGAVTFGNVAEGEVTIGTGLVHIAISPNARTASVNPLSFQLTVSGQPVSASLAVLIDPARERGLATHASGLVNFTVSNFGMFGLGMESIVPTQGAGFTYDGGDNFLWEGGLIMATSTTRVSSGLHSYIYASDYDFTVADGGAMEFWAPGGPIAQRARCATIDRNASDPINVRVEQESFSFESPDDKYIIMRFILRNESGGTITGLHFGLFTDWDVVQFNANAGGFESGEGYLWTAYNSGGLSNFRGVGMLQGNLTTALTQPGSVVVVPDEGGDGFTPLEKFNSLAAGTGSANTYKNATADLSQVMAVGPLTLADGEVDTVAYAIMAAASLVEMSQTFSDAQTKYAEVTIATDIADDPDHPTLPSRYALRQNYPNPFNPTTQISFDLPKASNYTLRVFNILGQEVYHTSSYATAGTVDIVWDGTAEASGVYFYKLETEEYSASRKMMLLK
jgi:subtilisin family serine protease